MESFIVPGALVRHPKAEDWGVGQVQSVIGNRITVNFENAGKRLINAEQIQLILVAPERDD
jgi:transcription elongation factor GreA-like protein